MAAGRDWAHAPAMDHSSLLLAQGGYYLAGPKTDRWLVKTVGALSAAAALEAGLMLAWAWSWGFAAGSR